MIDSTQNYAENEQYNADEEYLYNSALKTDAKHDAGQTRIKRIPLKYLKIENESEIPAKPENILIEPNRKHVEKALKEVDDQIAHHKKSLEELKEKIKSERTGNNPEIKRLLEEKVELNTALEPLVKLTKELEWAVKGPKEQLKSLKAEKEYIARDLDITRPDQLDAEIKSIQSALGFSSLSVSEEKKMIEKKNRLEAQKPKVIKFAELNTKIKALHDSNDKAFTQLKVHYEKRKTLYDRLTVVLDKLKVFFDNKKQNDPNIKILELQRENIKGEIDKCYEKKREIEAEYEDKLYHFKQQQNLLDYIKNAVEKINELKKREEKDRKRKEKYDKINAENDKDNAEVSATPVVVDPYAYEIHVCEYLISYFKNLSGVRDNQTVNAPSQQANVTRVNDIGRNLVEVVLKKEDLFDMGNTVDKTKKKAKGPKVSKREQKFEATNHVTLDIGIIKQIQEVNLSPPSMKTEIPAFINNLERIKSQFENRNQATVPTVNPVVVPEVVVPQVVVPEVVVPQVVVPKVVVPEVVVPKVEETKVVEPVVPKVEETKVVEPEVVVPHVEETKVVEPETESKTTLENPSQVEDEEEEELEEVEVHEEVEEVEEEAI